MNIVIPDLAWILIIHLVLKEDVVVENIILDRLHCVGFNVHIVVKKSIVIYPTVPYRMVTTSDIQSYAVVEEDIVSHDSIWPRTILYAVMG